MYDDADASKTRSALESAERLRIELQRLLGDGQNKVPGLQDEGFAGFHDDRAHQSVEPRLRLQIDKRMPAVFKHVELVAQAEIDRTTSELLRRQSRSDL